MLKSSLLLSLGLLLGACNPASVAPAAPAGQSLPAGQAAPAAKAVPGQDAFAIDMFRQVVAEQKGNVIFSPASLENLLDLLKQGARGCTLAVLDKVPMGKRGVKSAMRVESADALFIADDMKLKPVKVRNIQRVSFVRPTEAARTINGWCNVKTHGLIPSIVSADMFDARTRMVAANAVYLKERWLRPFPASATMRDDFCMANGKAVTVPMMSQKARFRYAEGEDWAAVALPYDTQGRAGEPGCFIGILPKGDARAFAATLTPQKYGAIRKALASARESETIVQLPKMDVTTAPFSLKSALSRNGLAPIFTESDFTGFADEGLYVDEVLQRCHIIVDEEKTEAAAVSVATVRSYCITQPNVIYFNRPFIWAIDDLTTASAPFFMGLFEKP